MQKLIIARSGEYAEFGDYSLTPLGKLRMENLARKLVPVMNGSVPVLLTSPAPRAKQGADIMAPILGAVATEHDLLWADDDHDDARPAEALHLILSHEPVASMVVVTHLPYSETLAYLYGETVLQMRTFPRYYTDKGAAWVIDCGARTCVSITG